MNIEKTIHFFLYRFKETVGIQPIIGMFTRMRIDGKHVFLPDLSGKRIFQSSGLLHRNRDIRFTMNKNDF